jgi:acetylornithine deacetylase
MHAWIYGMPEITEQELDQEVKEFFKGWFAKDPILKDNPPEINQHTRFLEGSIVPNDHPIVNTVINCCKKVMDQDITAEYTRVTGDLGILVNWGKTPTIVFGPRGGNLHDSDEYVIAQDLIDLVSIYAHTIVEWCGVEE